MFRRRLTAWLLLAVMCFATTTPAHSSSRKPKTTQITLTNDWCGRKVVFLGDSITDKNNVSSKIYWQYLAEMLGLEPYVYGINGHQWSNIPSQIARMKADGIAPDAIFIFAGTNDYNANVPLGEWYNPSEVQTVNVNGKMVERQHRTLASGKSTLCGRINDVILALRNDYPTAQIVLITPLHRGFATFGSGNVQPDESYANGLGLYINDYVDTIREASSVWSVPVIDLFAESGIIPNLPSNTQYITNTDRDRLHPNAEGHRRMAKVMAYAMLAMPASFVSDAQ